MANLLDVFDSFIINHENITKGFSTLAKGYPYLVGKDPDHKVVCFILDTSGGNSKVLIDKYLEDAGKSEEHMTFETEHMKKNSDRYKELIDKKICLLDKKLVLYGQVKEVARVSTLKKFTGDLPKQGFNIYETI